MDVNRSSDVQQTDRAAIGRAWRATIINGMASYLDAAAIVTSGTVLVIWKKSLGLTSGQVGQLSSLLTLMIAVGAIIGGRLGDRFGRRPIFTVTMGVYAVGSLLLLLAPSIPVLYIGMFLLGFGVGADLPVSLASISEHTPAGAKAGMIQFSQVIWGTGQVVVMVIGIIVGNKGMFGARILVAHLLLVSVIVGALRLTVAESTEWLAAREKRDGLLAAGEKLKPTWTELIRAPYLLPLIGISLFYGFINIAANTFGQFSTYLYTVRAGLTVSQASLVQFVAVGLAIVTSLIYMRVVDQRRGRYRWFGIGALGKMIGFCVPLIFGGSTATILTANLTSNIGGQLSGEPAFKIWAQELFPARLRSSAQGFGIFFTRIFTAVVALFTPGLLDTSNGFSVLFLLVIGFLLVGYSIGWFGLRRTRTAAQREAATDITVSDAESSVK